MNIPKRIVYNCALKKHLFSGNCAITFSTTFSAPKCSQGTSTKLNIEEPIIVVNEFDCVDIIGPPDCVSNLRQIVRRNLENETSLQKRLRKMQEATQEWNQRFWSDHNTKFINERQKYIELHLKNANEKQLTAEEMSEFYKTFLDKNWSIHVKYNMEWYKKNFTLLLFALQVCIEKLTKDFIVVGKGENKK